MNSFHKIYSLFLKEKKSQIFILLSAMLGMAFFQTAGIASILPFITVMANPEIILTNSYFVFLYIRNDLIFQVEKRGIMKGISYILSHRIYIMLRSNRKAKFI